MVIRAVEDTVQVLPAGAQHAVHAEAEGRCLDFPAVGRAHGGEQVGVDEGGFHETELSVKLHPAGVEQARRQAGLAQGGGREIALITQVVDRKDGARCAESLAVEGFQVNRNEAGGPVVQVDDVRDEAQRQAAFQDGLAEENEALGVVRVVSLAGSVQRVAQEVAVVFQQVDRHRFGKRALVNEPFARLVPGFRRDLQAERRQRDARRKHRAVFGEHHPHIVAEGLERRGQGAGHIGQAAGLGEGLNFGRNEKDLERSGHGFLKGRYFSASPRRPRAGWG